MHEVDGYTLGKPLLTTGRSEVLLATRERDGATVVVKRYSARTGVEEGDRTQREYEILRKLAGPGIIGALDLIHTRGQTILVMEHAPGLPLAQYIEDHEIDERQFLFIGLAATEAVERVHAARYLHRDIKPRNILVSEEPNAVHLIDFGIAAPLGQASRNEPDTTMNGIDGTLLYISPEQTGRMDRGTDYRSDLYSLGATFYHMLTGEAPFPLEDPLALIHAHIARKPVPPVEQRPGLSPVLSQIIMKLLEKEPERRYQTASALANDLRTCRDQLVETGRIDPELVLGGGDGPYRPLFSKTLYGREAEIERLHTAYVAARGGRPRFLAVSGPPGVGKSALVGSLRTRLIEDMGALATGRFDTYSRERPYHAIRMALDALVNQWLTEPEEQLRRRAERLRESLGAIAAVVVDLVPDLALVLGDVAAVPALGPNETRNRLCVAIERFATGAATDEHPLVLQLDDIQWADAGSLLLLEAMLRTSQPAALLVVATADLGGETTGRKVGQMLDRLVEDGVPVDHLELGPLPVDACAKMLAEALRREEEDTQWLAQCVERKTGSYPLQVQQLVELMHARGLIEYRHPTGWVWEESAVEAAEIPDSAVAIMTEKIAQLSGPMRESLSFMSCVGDPFDIDRLCALSNRSRDALEGATFELCDLGVLVASHSGFKFSHDRIREAARALLPESALAEIHRGVGLRLLELTPEGDLADNAFVIADHLNRAGERLLGAERQRACEVNIHAGIRSLAKGAAATALESFKHARDRIGAEFWETQPELAFELYLQGAESAIQTRAFEEALEWIEVLERRSPTGMQAVRVATKRIFAVQMYRPAHEALEIVLDAAARFGTRWPRRPSWIRVCFELLRTRWLLRHCADEDFFRPIDPKRMHKVAPVLILSAGGTALSRCSVRFVCMLTALALRTYHRHGYPYSPSFALAAFGPFGHAFFRGGRVAPRFAEAALQWSERVPDQRFGPRTEICADGYVASWFQARNGFAERLRPLMERCLESGDLEYGAIAAQVRANIGALSGEPLDAVEQFFAGYARVGSGSPFIGHFDRPYAHLRAARLDEPALERELEEARSLVTRDSFMVYLALHWMVALNVLGRFEDALALSDQVAGFALDASAMTSHVVDYVFYRALCAGAVAQTTRGNARKAALRTLKSSHRYLRRWSSYNADFLHMEQLIAAERAAIRGRAEEATGLYRSVASRATRQGYPQHSALAHERRAALLRGMRRELAATSADEEASDLYRRWGAKAKVALLHAAETAYE